MPKRCSVIFVAMLWAANSVRFIRGFAPTVANFQQREVSALTSTSKSCFQIPKGRRHPSGLLFATNASDNAATPPKKKKGANTGGLRRLPVVKPANELLSRARRDAERVKGDR